MVWLQAMFSGPLSCWSRLRQPPDLPYTHKHKHPTPLLLQYELWTYLDLLDNSDRVCDLSQTHISLVSPANQSQYKAKGVTSVPPGSGFKEKQRDMGRSNLGPSSKARRTFQKSCPSLIQVPWLLLPSASKRKIVRHYMIAC